MKMDELRKRFGDWRKAQTGQAVLAYNLVWLLTDPTPITEAGLRELGFHLSNCGRYRVFSMKETIAHIDEHGFCEIDAKNGSGYIKTMGRLRGLLLSVGE